MIAAGLGLVFICAYHLAQLYFRLSGTREFSRFLERGGLDRFYRKGLVAVLNGFDQGLCPPEYLDQNRSGFKPENSASRAWNWRSYDRMLLLAAAYPILLPLLIWIISDTPSRLSNLQVLDPAAYWWQRPLAAAALVGLVFHNVLARRIYDWFLGSALRGLYCLILARPAPAGFGFDIFRMGLILAFASTGMVTAAGAMMVTIGFAAAAIVTMAGSIFFAGGATAATATAVAVWFAGATSIGLLSLVLLPVAVITLYIPFIYSIQRIRPSLVYPIYTLFLLSVLCSMPIILPEFPLWKGTILLFFGFFPLCNAVWDFLSLGLTRWCLRQSLIEAPVGWLPASFRAGLFNLLDITGALLCLGGLIFTLQACVTALNVLAPERVVSMTDLLLHLQGRGDAPDMTWLYLMVFSTLLPTLAHIMLFLLSLLMRFPPGFVRLWVGRILRSDQAEATQVNIACAALACWATLLATVPVLLWLLLPHGPDLHGHMTAGAVWLVEQNARLLGLPE